MIPGMSGTQAVAFAHQAVPPCVRDTVRQIGHCLEDLTKNVPSIRLSTRGCKDAWADWAGTALDTTEYKLSTMTRDS